jgi:hypothetical protein
MNPGSDVDQLRPPPARYCRRPAGVPESVTVWHAPVMGVVWECLLPECLDWRSSLDSAGKAWEHATVHATEWCVALPADLRSAIAWARHLLRGMRPKGWENPDVLLARLSVEDVARFHAALARTSLEWKGLEALGELVDVAS